MHESGEIVHSEYTSLIVLSVPTHVNIYHSIPIDEFERINLVEVSQKWLTSAHAFNDAKGVALVEKDIETIKKLQGKTIGITATA